MVTSLNTGEGEGVQQTEQSGFLLLGIAFLSGFILITANIRSWCCVFA